MSKVARSLLVLPDLPALAEAARARVVACMLESVRLRGRFTVALSGGSTPRALYQLLAQQPELPWDRTQLCFGDERAVPPGHHDSNARMVHEALTHHPFIPATNVHRIHAELPAAEAASSYQQTLQRILADDAPRFDLILLGLGADGHTASLFPHSAGLTESGRWVVSHWVDVQRSERISLTFPVLNAAREVLFLVAGPDKAQALRELLEGDGSLEELPARGVCPAQGTLSFFVDSAAASQLTG